MKKTILDRKIGEQQVIWCKLTGPRGGVWEIAQLHDGRIALIGPDTHGQFPAWLCAYIPEGQKITRAGGTTYVWSGWISEIIG